MHSEHQAEHLERRVVGMRRGRDVVKGADLGDLADAAKRDDPFAVLGRLLGVGLVELTRRSLDGAEVLSRQLERLRLVEFARDDEHAVVGLVVGAIEGLEPIDRHPLDIGPVADRRLAVVVPLERGGVEPLAEDVIGVVLPHLELVADHGHLGGQVFALDEAVDEPVGLEADGEVEVLVVGGHCLVIVRPIGPGGAVVFSAELGQDLVGLGKVLAPLEEHVLEEMGHAGLAVSLEARADEDGHIDGDGGGGVIGEENDLATVLEPVFGDTLDGGDFLGGLDLVAGGLGECPSCRGCQDREDRNRCRACPPCRPAWDLVHDRSSPSRCTKWFH